jgi:hypothetical protein
MNIAITTGELERTDNNTLNYRKVGVNQTMLRCKLVPMDYWVSSSDGVMMFSFAKMSQSKEDNSCL